MLSKEEIFEKIQGVLVDALSVEEEEVTPDARLFSDLEAESIDMLDIVFKLEKTFDIGKIDTRAELSAEDILTNADYVQDGKVNETGLKELRKRMPFTDIDAFSADPQVSKFIDMVTVQALCNFIENKLAAQAG